MVKIDIADKIIDRVIEKLKCSTKYNDDGKIILKLNHCR